MSAATSAISVTVTPTQASVGQNVTLRAQVTGYAPTGTVTFTAGGSAIGTATLSGGVATLGSSILAQGTHAIAASYAGDANNATSTASTVTLTVGARPSMTWQYGYDAMGRPNTVVDPNAQATYFYYDSLGHPDPAACQHRQQHAHGDRLWLRRAGLPH